MRCYLCQSKNIKTIKYKIKVYKCSNCGLVFIKPNLLPKDFYEMDKLPVKNDTMELIDTERRFNEYKLVFKNRKVLDFGCGGGVFLKKLKDNKITNFLCAVEPNEKYFYDLMTNFIWYSNIDNIPNNTFDYITMFHVLEHLKDPINVLKQLKSKLNKQGQIIIEIPNHNDALSIIYDVISYKNSVYIPWHFFYFNTNTLNFLLEKTGFEVQFIKQIQRYSLANHLHWLRLGKPNGHIIWSFLDNDILNQIYASQLAYLGTCDTLVALISKGN